MFQSSSNLLETMNLRAYASHCLMLCGATVFCGPGYIRHDNSGRMHFLILMLGVCILLRV
jgi:hypothetical protein